MSWAQQKMAGSSHEGPSIPGPGSTISAGLNPSQSASGGETASDRLRKLQGKTLVSRTGRWGRVLTPCRVKTAKGMTVAFQVEWENGEKDLLSVEAVQLAVASAEKSTAQLQQKGKYGSEKLQADLRDRHPSAVGSPLLQAGPTKCVTVSSVDAKEFRSPDQLVNLMPRPMGYTSGPGISQNANSSSAQLNAPHGNLSPGNLSQRFHEPFSTTEARKSMETQVRPAVGSYLQHPKPVTYVDPLVEAQRRTKGGELASGSGVPVISFPATQRGGTAPRAPSPMHSLLLSNASGSQTNLPAHALGTGSDRGSEKSGPVIKTEFPCNPGGMDFRIGGGRPSLGNLGAWGGIPMGSGIPKSGSLPSTQVKDTLLQFLGENVGNSWSSTIRPVQQAANLPLPAFPTLQQQPISGLHNRTGQGHGLPQSTIPSDINRGARPFLGTPLSGMGPQNSMGLQGSHGQSGHQSVKGSQNAVGLHSGKGVQSSLGLQSGVGLQSSIGPLSSLGPQGALGLQSGTGSQGSSGPQSSLGSQSSGVGQHSSSIGLQSGMGVSSGIGAQNSNVQPSSIGPHSNSALHMPGALSGIASQNSLGPQSALGLASCTVQSGVGIHNTGTGGLSFNEQQQQQRPFGFPGMVSDVPPKPPQPVAGSQWAPPPQLPQSVNMPLDRFSAFSMMPTTDPLAEAKPAPKQPRKLLMKKSSKSFDRPNQSSTLKLTQNDANPPAPAKTISDTKCSEGFIPWTGHKKGDDEASEFKGQSEMESSAEPALQMEMADLEQLMGIVRKLCCHPLIGEFLQPISALHPEVEEAYNAVIRRPIDLTKVASKVREGRYRSHQRFHSDVCRMFNNCIKFNTTNQHISGIARHLKYYFEGLWGEFADAPKVKRERRDHWYELVWCEALAGEWLNEACGALQSAIQDGLHTSSDALQAYTQELTSVSKSILSSAKVTVGSFLFQVREVLGFTDKTELEALNTKQTFDESAPTLGASHFTEDHAYVDGSPSVKLIEMFGRQPHPDDLAGMVRHAAWEVLDNVLAPIIFSFLEKLQRGSDFSAIWAKPQHCMWVAANRKTAPWPAMVLCDSSTLLAISEANQNRIPEPFKQPLRRQRNMIKSKNALLVEYCGRHEFAWVGTENTRPFVAGEDPDFGSFAPAIKTVTPKLQSAIEEAKGVLDECDLSRSSGHSTNTPEEKEAAELNEKSLAGIAFSLDRTKIAENEHVMDSDEGESDECEDTDEGDDAGSNKGVKSKRCYFRKNPLGKDFSKVDMTGRCGPQSKFALAALEKVRTLLREWQQLVPDWYQVYELKRLNFAEPFSASLDAEIERETIRRSAAEEMAREAREWMAERDELEQRRKEQRTAKQRASKARVMALSSSLSSHRPGSLGGAAEGGHRRSSPFDPDQLADECEGSTDFSENDEGVIEVQERPAIKLRKEDLSFTCGLLEGQCAALERSLDALREVARRAARVLRQPRTRLRHVAEEEGLSWEEIQERRLKRKRAWQKEYMRTYKRPKDRGLAPENTGLRRKRRFGGSASFESDTAAPSWERKASTSPPPTKKPNQKISRNYLGQNEFTSSELKPNNKKHQKPKKDLCLDGKKKKLHGYGKSRFRGVCSAGNRWLARIAMNSKKISLGTFSDEEAAAKKYDEAARFYLGPSARCNFDLDGKYVPCKRTYNLKKNEEWATENDFRDSLSVNSQD